MEALTIPDPDHALLRRQGLQVPQYIDRLSAYRPTSPVELGKMAERLAGRAERRRRSTGSAETVIPASVRSWAKDTGIIEFPTGLDDPWRLTGGRGFRLVGAGRLNGSEGEGFFLHLDRCEDFLLESLEYLGGRSFLLLSGCRRFSIRRIRCRQAEGVGMLLFDCHEFDVQDCLFADNLGAGVVVAGQSGEGLIRGCRIRRSRGVFNCDAAIHLCHVSPSIEWRDLPHAYHEPLPIAAKTHLPEKIVIEENVLEGCRAQGLYLEGAVNTLVRDNLVVANNKEGICLDWGSCYNVVAGNSIVLNGERANLRQEEIDADFIADYPLLPDGSSSMKLPGVSLDNGGMNLLAGNRISANFGGGVKMVRSALFNVLRGNLFQGNELGANAYVASFPAVYFLAMEDPHLEFRHGERLLDFLPSIGNRLEGNRIVGHLRPIEQAGRCRLNVVAGNDIMAVRDSRQRTLGWRDRLVRRILWMIHRWTGRQATGLERKRTG